MSEEILLTFKTRMKADKLCDKKTLRKEFNGSWLRLCMWLYRNEGFGFIPGEINLVDAGIVESKRKKHRVVKP